MTATYRVRAVYLGASNAEQTRTAESAEAAACEVARGWRLDAQLSRVQRVTLRDIRDPAGALWLRCEFAGPVPYRDAATVYVRLMGGEDGLDWTGTE